MIRAIIDQESEIRRAVYNTTLMNSSLSGYCADRTRFLRRWYVFHRLLLSSKNVL